MTMKREKTGGRVKGTPNKTTQTVRETLYNALRSEIIALPNYFAELPTEERINAIIKLLPYVLPKYSDAEFSSNEDIEGVPKIPQTDEATKLGIAYLRALGEQQN